MTTKTLSGYYLNGYTLAQAYSGVDVTGSATLGGAKANYGVDGVVALNAQYAQSVTNAGVVVGGSGGVGGEFYVPRQGFTFYEHGGMGGVGLLIGSDADVSNTGTIAGGAGGSIAQGGHSLYDGGFAGGGGTAIEGTGQFPTTSSVTNWNTISGGAGGAGGSATYAYYSAGPGGAGGMGISRVSTVINHGAIEGGAGGNGGAGYDAYRYNVRPPPLLAGAGGAGATGVSIETGYVNNSGRIAGGAGGAGGSSYYGGGGAGAAGQPGVLIESGTVINSGTVNGGQGGAGGAGCKGFPHYSPQPSGDGAGGAAAVDVATGYVNNSGLVTGGAGGAGGYSHTSLGGSGGYGGAGVQLGYGTVVNSGTIIGGGGGDGGVGGGLGGAGGAGVFGSGMLVNTGLIVGSQGGADDGISSGSYAPDGAAVQLFAGTLVNSGTIDGDVDLGYEARLITKEGALVVGTVLGNRGVLETMDGSAVVSGLAGSAGTLSGAMSMTFTGFVVDQIDQACTWTLAGFNTIVSGQTVIDNGAIVEHGDLTLGGAIGGSGLLTISQGESVIEAGAKVTVAQWSVRAPSLTIEGDLAYVGAFTEASRTVLTVKSGADLALSGETTLAGTVAGLGTLKMVGGASMLEAGAALLVAHWSLARGAVTVAENLVYRNVFSIAAGATLTLAAGDQLTLTGSNSVSGLVEGGGRMKASTVTVNGLTIGGTATLEVAKSATQTGAITVGDATADGATLIIDRGATWTMQRGGIALGESAASIIDLHGTLVHSGAGFATVSVGIDDTGSIVAAAGTLDLAGALIGTGALVAESGAALEVDDTAAKTLSMTLDGPGAVLALKSPTSFAATIAGFAATDRIHLLGLVAHGAVLGAGDILEIHQGKSIVATLQLTGDYTGETFSARPDGHGGTIITVSTAPGANLPAGARSGVFPFISAAASLEAGHSEAAHLTIPAHGEGPHSPLAAPRLQTA